MDLHSPEIWSEQASGEWLTTFKKGVNHANV